MNQFNPSTPKEQPAKNAKPAGSTFRVAAITLGVAIVAEVLCLFLAWQTGVWQLYALAGVGVLVMIFIMLRQAGDRIATSLRLKITIWTGAVVTLLSVVLVTYSIITSRQAAIDGAEKQALAISGEQARAVSEKLDLPLLSARTIAIALKGIKDSVNPTPMTRDQVNKMLYHLNVENPSFLGTDTLWEPNAFDGLDSQYQNTTNNDSTGRFIPYWVRRANGSVTVEALHDYETPGIGDWYVLPRQQKKEMVFAPLVYPINGVDTVMATFVVPIMQGDTFYGIVGVDAPISFVQGIVDSVNLYNGKANAVLLTASGTVIGFRSHPELVNQPATGVFADFKDLQPRLEKGETFISLSPDGKNLRVFSPVDIGNTGTRWAFGLIIPFSEITAQATSTAVGEVVISLILLGIALLILWSLTSQVVRPITALTEVASAVSQGNWNVTAEIKTVDETAILAKAFNTMTARLREFIGTLEQRVAERTHSLELAAEVGRSVSRVRALDVMLKDAAEIIRSRFDLYYVQVYLTNPSQTALILQSGTGTVGAELVNRAHHLPLNTGSINGRAAVEKRSVVISDTTASTTFRPNPLLPNTRSEMAVPLLIGEKVVGVLDMQSQQANALNQDSLSAFEALAGQLAIAIQNATFLAEAEQARAEVESLAGRQTRANWVDYLDAIHKPEETGFVFEQNKITPMTQVEQSQPSTNENALTAPITVTGEALGNLVVEMEGQSPISYTSELVNTVARQVAQQIENLRLLDSAERYRFEAEEASRRLTREGWKNYIQANADEGMSYIYDLKEVRSINQVEDQQTEEPALSLPLKVRDETVGKLAVVGLESNDTDSIVLANAVAERLGAHIESLRHYDQTQSALAQSEKLFEASRRLSQAVDLQELVKAAVETLNVPVVNRAILGAFSYNAAGELESMTDIANWWNGTGTEVAAVGTYYSAKALQLLSVFLSNTPLFFKDTFSDKRMGADGLQVAKSLNIRSGAVLPLLLGTRQLGILMLQAEEPHNFTPDETRLFSALAPQISTVMENRRQYEKAQQQAERESMLNIISQKIQGATTVETVLQIAARELGHALGAPLTIAQLGIKDRNNGGEQ